MALIEKGKAFLPNTMIEYAEGGIVSKEFIHTKGGSVTLFSFDKGQNLSEPEILIDGQPHYPKAGEVLIMPANHLHAVNAKTRFKMILTMIRG